MTVIYISDAIHSDVLDQVQATAEVRLGYGPDKVDYASIRESVDAVILRAEIFTRDMIAASPRLKIIARHGVGTDNVDLEAASDHGVWVTSTPGANSNAVAEHVFALLLFGARKVGAAADRVRSGIWSEGKADLVGFELSGRTLGVLGYGSIGRRVAAIGKGFGMDVLVSDPIATADDVGATGATLVSLDELVQSADVITVHVPLLPSTRHILGAKEIARMKPSAYVINTSRGGLIDEAALSAALEAGTIAGAALDVLEAESVDMKDPLASSPLSIRATPGLTVTPHIAGQTEEAFLEAGTSSWAAVKDVLAGGRPDYPVNQPTLGAVHA